MNMELPVIDILEQVKQANEFLFQFDADRDVWAADIELYAPGYPAIEAEGRAADYDLTRLRDPDEAYNIGQRAIREEKAAII